MSPTHTRTLLRICRAGTATLGDLVACDDGSARAAEHLHTADLIAWNERDGAYAPTSAGWRLAFERADRRATALASHDAPGAVGYERGEPLEDEVGRG